MATMCRTAGGRPEGSQEVVGVVLPRVCCRGLVVVFVLFVVDVVSGARGSGKRREVRRQRAWVPVEGRRGRESESECRAGITFPNAATCPPRTVFVKSFVPIAGEIKAAAGDGGGSLGGVRWYSEGDKGAKGGRRQNWSTGRRRRGGVSTAARHGAAGKASGRNVVEDSKGTGCVCVSVPRGRECAWPGVGS